MKSTPTVGHVHELSYQVTSEKTVPHVFEDAELFKGMPPVFATVYMVGLVEWACMAALAEHLEPGEQSVGTAINVSHTAPTPVGFWVKVSARVESVEGRRVRFGVRVEDETELIGEGTHERFVIVRERFMQGVEKKAHSTRS